ncbi:hypothetical protein [Streptomyces sp. NPDC059761]|uniref:hypothetical protein n=1 Tax=Streptomyces sp. NPDC059761 TaxID=3346937 RepID=UPI0036588BC9
MHALTLDVSDHHARRARMVFAETSQGIGVWGSGLGDVYKGNRRRPVYQGGYFKKAELVLLHAFLTDIASRREDLTPPHPQPARYINHLQGNNYVTFLIFNHHDTALSAPHRTEPKEGPEMIFGFAGGRENPLGAGWFSHKLPSLVRDQAPDLENPGALLGNITGTLEWLELYLRPSGLLPAAE